MAISTYLKQCQRKINVILKIYLPSTKQEPRHLHKAMHYAVLNGGKRIRAALVYAVGEALGANAKALNEIAAAIEMVHAYSLIHDDLPAIDNDDLRRGKPTCHKVFGEATAILAGDSLQSLAFEILANPQLKTVKPQNKISIISEFAKLIGSQGMTGGEELDTQAAKQKSISLKHIETIYQMKTSCLLKASIVLPALTVKRQTPNLLSNLDKFGDYLGLAFQIHDDIIGIESNTKLLGKKQGNDLLLNKPVYPVIAGMKNAKLKEKFYYKKALYYLDKCKIQSSKLKILAAFILERHY